MFDLIYYALVGLAAGSIAKMITPQKETGGWVSSIIVGIIGAIVGGILPLGFLGDSILANLGKAVVGTVLVLWVYHKYLADKLNLKV